MLSEPQHDVIVPDPTDPHLDDLVSTEGWLYASSLPVDDADPGRFHALFGRDALIAALQLLPVRPGLAPATLRALARRQGRREDPVTLEEVGKIGHEFRFAPPPGFVDAGWPDAGEFRYFASADATLWFLVVLAATGDRRLALELEPAWRGAAGWLARSLDAGHGLVRHHEATTPGGLVQHGWRDANDPAGAGGGGILRPDGQVPAGRLADADTQAVACAALRSLARIDPGGGWREAECALRARISAAFGPEVMAVEADGRPVSGAGSQLGWLLWAEALDPEASRDAADRLSRPDVLTAYGLRTLSSNSPVFDPHAYHRGSVWPFDSWLGWGGLCVAGRLAEAERVRRGVLDAIKRLGGAPELYAVTRAGRLEPIPVANRRQAWTVGARWALAHGWDGRVDSH
jgi:glycogen debranching enzyme